MFRTRGTWIQFSTKFKQYQTRPFRVTATRSTNNNTNNIESSVSKYDEAYRQLDKLDFMTAARILFTNPPKKKKFGIDFHLVQLFFACMPSLAVYLVAQYAHHEMRKMDAELEQKKRGKEEKEKEKEEESNTVKGKETEDNPELLEVKVRLNKLEEAVKEIVIESKKQSNSSITKKQEDHSEKKQQAAVRPRTGEDSSDSTKPVNKEQLDKKESAETHTKLERRKD